MQQVLQQVILIIIKILLMFNTKQTLTIIFKHFYIPQINLFFQFSHFFFVVVTGRKCSSPCMFLLLLNTILFSHVHTSPQHPHSLHISFLLITPAQPHNEAHASYCIAMIWFMLHQKSQIKCHHFFFNFFPLRISFTIPSHDKHMWYAVKKYFVFIKCVDDSVCWWWCNQSVAVVEYI